jgi:hypothetical protein
MGETCTWRQENDWDQSDHWTADCGLEWVTLEGKPAESGMKFCPGCGKPLVEVLAPDSFAEDDDE